MDAYKDYVDIDEESKPVEASSPYSGYVDIDSLEEVKPAETKSSGMGYLDTAKSAVADFTGGAAAGLTAAQVAAEKAGFPAVARVARAGSMGLHRAEEAINETITPEGRASKGAALIPDDGQEQLGSHPVREALMKGSGIVAPAAVGFAGGALGAMLAGPAGAAAGTAGAGALYGLATGVDQAVAWTNDLNDEDLAKEAPVFGKFKQMYLEENIGKGMDQQAAEKQASYDARVALHDGLYGIKQAAFDAGTNALAFGAGRKVLSGLGGSGLTDYVLSGGALGAVSAASDVNQQNVEIAKKGEGEVDPFKAAIAFLNGTAEGIAFHGVGEGAKKLAKWSGFKPAETPETQTAEATDKDAVNTPPSDAPTTGEVPKGARTGEPPKPNESAQEGQIGNTVNPPTRDQETPATAAKKTSKRRSKKNAGVEGSVTVLDENTPPPAEAQALQQSTPGAPDTVQLAEPPQPVTPEVTAPEISPQTEVPEAGPTIEAQVTDFFDKKRDVIRFNNADQVPADRPKGVRQHQGSDGSVWWHRPRKVPQGKIEQSIKAKTENELLGLGPFNKEAVAADIAAGGQELAAVARDENGVEVAAAGTTDRLAPETIEAVREANPDKTVTLEQPQQVIEGRLDGTGKPKGRGRRKVDEIKVRQERLKELSSQLPSKEAVRSQMAEAGDRAAKIAGFDEASMAQRQQAREDFNKRYAENKAEFDAALDEMRAIRERLSNRGETQEAPADPNAFDEALARREAEEQLRSAQPKIDREGRRVLPPPPTEENIRALVEQRRAEWKVEQEKAAAEERRAKRDLEEAEAEEKENAPPAPPEDFKSKKNPKRDRERTEKRAKADELFEAHKDGMSTSGRGAILKRIQTILAEAKDRGVSVVSKLDYDKHSAGQAFLKEAQILASRARASKTKLPTAEDISRFVQAEYDLRDGLEGFDRYKKNARAEGDRKNQRSLDTTRKTEDSLEYDPRNDELTDDDRESERQSQTLADVAVDRPDVEDYQQEPVVNERPKVALKGDEITAGVNRAGDVGTKIKVETKRRVINRPGVGPKVQAVRARTAEPDVRPMVSMRSREEAAADFDRRGEGAGRVSIKYGPDAPAIKIERTSTVEDMFAKTRIPIGGLQGAVFPIIRRRLMQTAGKVKVHFVDGAEFDRIAKDKYPDADGVFDAIYKPRVGDEGGYIVMSKDIPAKDVSRVFAHEAMHAATEEALRSDERFRNTIKDIMNEVAEERPELLTQYGFTNASEFIAEAFSNREFQQHLGEIKVSARLAKQLGLEKPSMWQTLVTAIRQVLRMEPGHYSALEALIRPVDKIMRINAEIRAAEGGGEARPFIRDAAKDMIDRFDNANLKDFYGRLKRGASSNTMIAMMGQKLGPKFGYFARKAVELQQKMAVHADNELRREGGALEITREATALRKAKPEMMLKAEELGFKAREYDLDMTPGAKNDHIFGTSAKSDILNAAQAKKAYGRLRAELDKLDPDVRGWLEKAAKFFREEDNFNRLTDIKRVIGATDAEQRLASAVVRGDMSKAEGTVDALAQRIFDGKMTEKDEELFKSDVVIRHLNQIAELKRLKGWYFPFEREGDYTLSARRDFTTPTGKHVYRLLDKDGTPSNELIFTDPQGRNREAPARRAAQAWMQELDTTDDLRAKASRVYVLESDPTKVISNAEANAIGAPKTFRAYKVEVRNEYFDLFKDPAARNAAAKELAQQGWGKLEQSVRRQNPNASFGGLVPSQMRTLINSLENGSKFKAMPEAQQNDLRQSLRQSVLKLMPGPRIQHHNIQSRGIAGYSKDMVSGIAKYGERSARFRARAEFMPQISDMLSSAQEEITLDRYSKQNEERQLVLRDLESRLLGDNAVNHEGFVSKTLDTLNKISLIDKLFGPSFHFINAQEPWTTAAPIIGGRHGFVKTVRTMKAAYDMIGGRTNAFMPGLRDTLKAARGENTDFTDYRANFKAEIGRTVGGERAKRLSEMLDYLHDRNLFGHEAGMEVARLADTGGAKWEQALDRIDLVSRQVGQAIEAINRSVTALSAYELEYARTKNHQGAMRYAHDMVHDTMGNYSASNSAPVFNRPFGRAMLQFKKFAQKTYFLLGKTLGKAYEGDKEAQKALLGVLFTHGVVAGALGLPIEPIKAAVIVSNALGVSPYSWDEIEAAIREEAAQIPLLGKKGAMALTRGVPRAFLGYDASGRQGMADLMVGLGPRSTRSNDLKSWLFDTVAGPSISMPFKMAEGVQKATSNFAKGDMSGAAREALDMFPVKFVRDFARAGYGAVEGRKDKTGRELMAPYTPAEALLQAAGLTPSRRAEEAEMRSKFIGAEQKRNQDRRGLIADWVNATPEGKRDAMSAIQQYNQSVPANAKIKQADLTSAMKRRKTEKAQGTYDRGMRVTKQNRDIHDRMNQVYGE